jgi:RNA polymerase sigma-70 factor (ECF subfamily)
LKKCGEDNESLLIAALKNGSYKAFDALYERYAKRLYGYCLQLTKSPEDSEEIVQDVFLKLWNNRLKIRQEETLRSLLFLMIKHQVINLFRAKINQPVYEEYTACKEQVSVGGGAQRHLEYLDFVERFKKEVNNLPDTQREVVRLSKVEQLSNQEIAVRLSLSEQTVKNQLSLGLKILKSKLGICVLLFVNILSMTGTVH